jgi:hypothetical protein
MTSNEYSEAKRSVYDTCDPQYLRGLRETAGMDVIVLARTACLSVAQVRQLESDDNDSLFYSDAIKRQAYKRLLMILGAEPPTVELPEELRDAGKVAEAHLNTLDQIVAMSHQPTINRTTSDLVGSGIAKLSQHKQALGALLLLVVAVVLFVLNDSRSAGEAAPVSDSASTPTSVLPAPVVAVEHPPVAAAPALVASLPVVAPVASAPVSAPTAVVAVSTAAPVAAVAASAADKATACAYSNDVLPQLTSLYAPKEGRYVYLVSAANTDVCVVDANKQATALQLKAGESRSVYGAAPWQVSGSNLQKVQIYFQGGRVSLPDSTTNRIKLVEVPVAR